VAVREVQGESLYLVVSSSDGEAWVLPKGHIEAGEPPEGAALRELFEEAGVEGVIDRELCVQHFDKATEAVVVRYFLVLARGDSGSSPEGRTIRWESKDTALNLLTYEDARNVLVQATVNEGIRCDENG